MQNVLSSSQQRARPEQRKTDSPHDYRLTFEPDETGDSVVLEFKAFDAYQALVRAKAHSLSRGSELWRDGHKICSLRLLPHGVWEVTPAGVQDG